MALTKMFMYCWEIMLFNMANGILIMSRYMQSECNKALHVKKQPTKNRNPGLVQNRSINEMIWMTNPNQPWSIYSC